MYLENRYIQIDNCMYLENKQIQMLCYVNFCHNFVKRKYEQDSIWSISDFWKDESLTTGTRKHDIAIKCSIFVQPCYE